MALITAQLMTCILTMDLVISNPCIMELNTFFTMITMMTITIFIKSQIPTTPSFIFNQVATMAMTKTMSTIMTSATSMLKLITVTIRVTIHSSKQVITTMVYHIMMISLTACLTMTNSPRTTVIPISMSTWLTTAKWVTIVMKISHTIESLDMDTQMTIQWTSSFMGNGPMIYPIQDSDTTCMDLITVTKDTLLMLLLCMTYMQRVTMVMTVIWQCQCTMAMVSESLSLIIRLSQTFFITFYWLCLIHSLKILIDFLGNLSPQILPLNLIDNWGSSTRATSAPARM